MNSFKRKNMKSKILILIICQIAILPIIAQEHLNIKNVFDKYGKQEGSVLVQLSTDILSQGSKITFYKSLIINESDDVSNTIIRAVESDVKKGSKISEIKKNGKIETGTYVIKMSDNSYEYILFKNKSKKLTLVYLKGNFAPDNLDKELSKLKDLFIYVNNKRIKLQ